MSKGHMDQLRRLREAKALEKRRGGRITGRGAKAAVEGVRLDRDSPSGLVREDMGTEPILRRAVEAAEQRAKERRQRRPASPVQKEGRGRPRGDEKMKAMLSLRPAFWARLGAEASRRGVTRSQLVEDLCDRELIK